MAHHETATGPAADPLPQTRDELLALHRETRRAAQRRGRTAARSTCAAIDLLGRIEVEVARIERAMDPPLALTGDA